MNPFLLLLGLFLCGPFGYTTASDEFSLMEEVASDSEYFTEIPFTYVRNKILIQVEVGGKPRTFLLDTGAPFMVDEKLAQEMGYRDTGTKGLRDASGNRTRVQKVTVPEIRIGTTRFSNLPALVYDFHGSLLNCFQIDGIIGSNILNKSVLQIDVAAGLIRLTKHVKHLNVEVSQAIPIRLKSKQYNPMVPVRIDDEVTIWSLLDTGSDDFYSISQDHLAACREQDQLTQPPLSRAEGSASLGLIGGNEDAYGTLIGLNSLAFKDQLIAGQIAIESNHDNDSRIGMKLLERGLLTLDYRRKRVWFEPYPDQPKYYYTHTGLGFVPEDGNWIIREVWSGSDAEREGIAKGDTLLAFGQLNFSELSVCDVMFKLPDERGKSSIRVDVRHADGRGDQSYLIREISFFGD